MADSSQSDDRAPEADPHPPSIAQDIILEAAGRLAHSAIEKGWLLKNHEPDEARAIAENRSLVRTIATFGVTRIATRSIPGAMLVGGGLLMKMLFDRSQSRRKRAETGGAKEMDESTK